MSQINEEARVSASQPEPAKNRSQTTIAHHSPASNGQLEFFRPLASAPGSSTSAAAARSVRQSARTQRADVLGYVVARGRSGATAEEVADGLGLRIQSTTARIHELRQMSMLRDSGHRRRTSSGRAATVWIAMGGGCE